MKIFRFFYLVGLAGLEPATFRPPDGRATRLRHSPPIRFFLVIFFGRASEKRADLMGVVPFTVGTPYRRHALHQRR